VSYKEVKSVENHAIISGGGVPSVLQEVQVPVIENSVCQEMFHTSGHAKNIISSFLCAGYANGQKDSCEVCRISYFWNITSTHNSIYPTKTWRNYSSFLFVFFRKKSNYNLSPLIVSNTIQKQLNLLREKFSHADVKKYYCRKALISSSNFQTDDIIF